MDRIWRSVRCSLASRPNAHESNSNLLHKHSKGSRSPLSAAKKQQSWDETTQDCQLTARHGESDRRTTALRNSISDSVDLKATVEPHSRSPSPSPQVACSAVQIDSEYCNPADSLPRCERARRSRHAAQHDAVVTAYSPPAQCYPELVDDASIDHSELDPAEAGLSPTMTSQLSPTSLDCANESGDEREEREERQRPKMGLKAVKNARQRVVGAPTQLDLPQADETAHAQGSPVDLQASIRSARQLLSLISPSEPGTTTESSSTELSNDADSAKIWHKNMPNTRDDSFDAVPDGPDNSAPCPLTLDCPKPVQHSALYDQPWDDQAKRLQLMLHMTHDDKAHQQPPVAIASVDVAGVAVLPCGVSLPRPRHAPSLASSVPGAAVVTGDGTKTANACRHGTTRKHADDSLQRRAREVYTSGLSNFGTESGALHGSTATAIPALCACGCGRPLHHFSPASAAVSSLVSPLRQRSSHTSQTFATSTMHAGFSYVMLNAAGGGTHVVSNAAYNVTPTRRRNVADDNSCQCTLVRQHGSLVPAICSNCVARYNRQHRSHPGCENLVHSQCASTMANTSLSSLVQDDASPQLQHLTKPLHESRSWFFGSLSRHEAENLLRNEPESTFLVRKCESSKVDYALSIRSTEGFVHMKISRHVRMHAHAADGVGGAREFYVLGTFSQPYDSVADIVRHFSSNTLPVKGVRGLMLKFALRRDRSRSLSGVGSGAERHERSRPNVSVQLPVATSALFRPISSARAHVPAGPHTCDVSAVHTLGAAHGHSVLKPRFVAQSSLPANTALVANRAVRN